MGTSASSFPWSGKSKEFRIWMFGADGGGKTTLLYRLKLGENVNTIPTIGFNVESVSYKNRDLVLWEVGGTDKIRPQWGIYFENTDAIIFVVDAAESDRFGDAAYVLRSIFQHSETQGYFENLPILIFANRQDQSAAKAPVDVLTSLGIEDILQGRKWHVVGSSFTQGEGITEGMDWLVRAIDSR